MIILQNSRKFNEYKYKFEDKFEKDIVDSHSNFFGAATIYIDAKKKIGSQSLAWIPTDINYPNIKFI